MEDLFKFLPLIAIVAAAIWKEAKKNKAKQEATKQGTPPRPELADDAIPLPEAWGKLFGPEELLNPKPIENPAKKQMERPFNQTQKKKEKIQKVESKSSSTAGRYVPVSDEGIDHHSSEKSSSPNTNNESEFAIHSAEEARRAIIWGEILQRKY